MVGYRFTVEEVDEMLPEVEFLVEEAMSVYHELKESYANALKIKTSTGGETMANLQHKTQRHIQVLNEELHDIIEELDDMGVQMRDIQSGLVDFPGVFQGKPIFYCWKYGEDKVEHWHEEESSERKKIFRIGK